MSGTHSYLPIKRLFDIAASGAALLLLSPLLIAIALVIRLESEGSPLFTQARVGQGGRLFPIWKFRSMVHNAAALGPYWTADNDPRITRVGRILRKTSLDELPQLANVLWGDMSLIGPRPDTPAQQPLYPERHWQERHRLRPGLTGLAQVMGRSAISLPRRMACDRYYIRRASARLDAFILLQTVDTVLRRRGSN